MRILSETPKVELMTVALVLLYMVVIVSDIAIPDIFYFLFECDDQLKDNWRKIFWVIDMGFLSLFMVELSLRVFAWGTLYFRDFFNVADAIIIIGSFAVSIIVFNDVFNTSTSGDTVATNTGRLTRLIRIVRVFRLLTALTKFQKNRGNSEVIRKKVRAQ